MSKTICIAALPDSDFCAFKNFALQSVHKNRSVHSKRLLSVYFDDLSSNVNFVNNDMLNIFVVNFDNFCKNTFNI